MFVRVSQASKLFKIRHIFRNFFPDRFLRVFLREFCLAAMFSKPAMYNSSGK